MPEYLVFYANSREQARVSGQIHAGFLKPDLFTVSIEVNRGMYVRGSWVAPGQVLMLDPRCVIWDEQGQMAYDPREHTADMDRNMRRWMADHPRWPPKQPPAADAAS